MFIAYFDDSGTHDDSATEPGSQIVAAAGYVASPAVWESFEAQWNAFLKREHLTHYHAAECATGGESFRDWPPGERNRLHREAVSIITAHPLVAVGHAGLKAAFNELYHEALPDQSRRRPKASYYNALVNAWRLLGLYASSAKLLLHMSDDELISIVIEDAPKRYGDTLRSFEESMQLPDMQRLRRHFAGPPVFRPKLGLPQLQAADVLAYELTLNLRRMFLPNERPGVRGSYTALAQHAHEHALKVVGYPLLVLDSHGFPFERSAGGAP